jgi:hypothetical protein
LEKIEDGLKEGDTEKTERGAEKGARTKLTDGQVVIQLIREGGKAKRMKVVKAGPVSVSTDAS